MKLFLFGLLLTLFSWSLAWGKFIPGYQYSFFPLWLGYILTINGLALWLIKKSLLTKMGLGFILLFLISIPFWWFFEILNLLTNNWQYIGSKSLNFGEYFIRASISFSTVVPAIFSTAFLNFNILNKIKSIQGKKRQITRPIILLLFELGILSFLLISVLPEFSYPLLWLGVLLIFEPFN